MKWFGLSSAGAQAAVQTDTASMGWIERARGSKKVKERKKKCGKRLLDVKPICKLYFLSQNKNTAYYKQLRGTTKLF